MNGPRDELYHHPPNFAAMIRTLTASLLTLFSLAAHAQWVLTTPIKSRSEFEAIRMVSDSVGFAVDKPMGAILRTRDGGTNWERLANSLSNAPVALFMWDHLRGIAVGESGHVYRTTDAFETITGGSNPTYGELSCVFFVNDTLGWVGSLTGKIYRSENGGASWTLMNSGQSSSNYMTAIQFLDTQTGYASCYGGEMLKSTDGGLTWQGVGPFDQLVLMRDLHFYDTQLGVAVGSAGEVIRTTDGGATWDSIPSNSTYTMFDMDVQDDVIVACGANGRMIRSTDAGLTWNEFQVGANEHKSLSLTPSGVGLLGTDGRIQRTTDMGQTWTIAHDGTWHTLINKMAFMNADTGLAVGWQSVGGLESGLLRTTDGGRHWKKAGTGGLGVHVTPTGIGCLGGGSGSFARTTNSFLTRTAATGPLVAIRCTWSFDANTHIVAGGYVNGGMYRTTNGGANWTYSTVGNLSIFDLFFVNDLLGFAVGEGGIAYRTIDGGVSWNPMNSPLANDQFTVFFLNEQLGWMGGANSGARTTDGGDTWEVMGGIPPFTRAIFFTDADTGYAVGNSGQVVRSVDGGQTWDGLLPDILNVNAGDAAWVDGAIVMGCNNGDIFRAQVSCPSIAFTPTINELGDLLCTTAGANVQWYLDGEPLPGENGTCISPESSGAYTVMITDELGCSSAPSAPVQVIITDVEENERIGLHLFPDPASDILFIEQTGTSPAQLLIMDAQGRVIRSARMNGPRVSIDVSDLSPGLHVIRIVVADHVQSARFVKD